MCTTSNIPAGGPSSVSPHWQRPLSLPVRTIFTKWALVWVFQGSFLCKWTVFLLFEKLTEKTTLGNDDLDDWESRQTLFGFVFFSPGSWKHLQLWGRWVWIHCQDHMPSSLGDFSWTSASLLELQLKTNQRKSGISQFSLDPAGVQSDMRWTCKLPQEGRKNIDIYLNKTRTQDKTAIQKRIPD